MVPLVTGLLGLQEGSITVSFHKTAIGIRRLANIAISLIDRQIHQSKQTVITKVSELSLPEDQVYRIALRLKRSKTKQSSVT